MENKINDYVISKPLGQGAFGKVFLVKSPTNEQFAAKVVETDNKIKEDVRKEAVLQSGLNHPHVLSLRQYFFWDSEKYFVIIAEYCNQGSLVKIIGQENINIRKLLLGMALGLQYLHNQKKIVHRDLKPENILMKKGIPVVADLGISRIVKSSGMNSKVGTGFYMAYEMMESDKYGLSVDIWALGIIFLEVCLGELLRHVLPGVMPPCQRQNFPAQDLLSKIKDSEMRKLVVGMLKKQPSERLTINEVVNCLNGKSISMIQSLKRKTTDELGMEKQPKTKRSKEYFQAGQMHYNNKNYDLSLEDYSRAIQLQPRYVWAYLGRGSAYHYKKDYEAALKDYNTALTLDPTNAGAYCNRGNIYKDYYKDYDQALQDYNVCLQHDPTNSVAYHQRGIVYKNYYKNNDQALQDYNRAIQLNPNFALAYFNRGLTHYAQKNYGQALQDYNKCQQLDPNYANAYCARGAIYMEHYKNNEQALKDYNKAIQLNPNFAIAYYNRGNIHREQKNYEQAIQDYSKYLQFDPTDADAIKYRSIALKQLKEKFDQ